MRIIGTFLQDNWEKKVVFRNTIIRRKIKIMCRPMLGSVEKMYGRGYNTVYKGVYTELD